MPRLTLLDRQRVRDISAELDALTLAGPTALGLVAPAVRDLLDAEKAAAFSIKIQTDRISLDDVHGVGFDIDSFRHKCDRLFTTGTAGWTFFDPLRPEAPQRNRALVRRQLERLTGRKSADLPITTNVLAPMALAEDDLLRALICDGPTLLAWVGALQPAPFERRQQQLLAALIPPLQRRLKLERQFRTMPRTVAALDAALNAIAAPAFIASSRGSIFETNKAGAALLEREGRNVNNALRETIARRPASIRCDVTPLQGGGEPPCFLVVVRAESQEPRLHTALAHLSTRLKLTRREISVLELLSSGMANATMASTLGISEATIEFHVSNLFDKAGVESRSALVGRLIGG